MVSIGEGHCYACSRILTQAHIPVNALTLQRLDYGQARKA